MDSEGSQTDLTSDLLIEVVAKKPKTLEPLSRNGEARFNEEIIHRAKKPLNAWNGHEETSPANSNTSRDDSENYLDDNSFAYQYPIVKNIFEKLPIADLLRCACVCKTWSEVARLVRKKRKNEPSLFLYHPYLPHTKEIIEFYNGDIRLIACEESVKFVNTTLFSPKEEEEGDNGCLTSCPLVTEQIRPAISKAFANSYDEHESLIFFGTPSLNSCISKRHTPQQQYTRQEHLFPGAGVTSKALACFGTGLAMSVSDGNNSFYNVEMENNDYPMLTALAIPKVPGLKTKIIHITDELRVKYRRNITAETCEEILGIEPDDKVKGILMFQHKSRNNKILRHTLYQYLRLHPSTSVGGGVMEDLITSTVDSKSLTASGLLICGDDNVKVFSVALFENGITERNLEVFKGIRAKMLPGDVSFAFMFACCCRGGRIYDRKCHVESRLFKEYFPTTPLVGAFTLGEYVHEYIPGEQATPPSKPSSIEFGYSTVFVIVSVSRSSREFSG